ncbi:MAG: T9SS type A sorting domain-containing protein [Chlorobi bacterium]|nr:T9SS type A sorting domain-containing protein [Chlorobiota bacterium]
MSKQEMKYLDKLGKLRADKPLFDKDELTQIIEKAEPATGRLLPIPSSINLTRIITMISATAAIILLLSLLLPNDNLESTTDVSDNTANLETLITTADENPDKSDITEIKSDDSSKKENLSNKEEIIETSGKHTKHKTKATGKKSKTKDEVSYSTFRAKTVNDVPKALRPDSPAAGDEKKYNVPGVTVLTLSVEEAGELGVNIDDKTCSFEIERMDRIHPIPFRRDPKYKKSVKKVADAGYNTAGKIFIRQSLISFDITNARIFDIKDSLRRERTNLETFPNSSNNWYDMNESERAEYQRKSKLSREYFSEILFTGNNAVLLKYDGREIDSYSKISPLWYGCDYKKIGEEVIRSVENSPIVSEYMTDGNIRNFTELVPVRINLKDFENSVIDNMIFWFYPTDEFIEALPKRYSANLRNEMDIMTIIKNGDMPVEEACKGLDHDNSLFDMCRLSSGVLTVESVYPNPADKAVTLKFNLKENRKVTIRLHDSQGRSVGIVKKYEAVESGINKQSIDISNLRPGVYMLVITTDKSEQVAVRVIKK